MCSRRLLTFGGSIAVSLLLASNAFAALTSAEQKCIDGYNNFLRLVSAQAGKSATSCIKNATKDGSDPDNCIINNTDGKIAGKEAKVSALYSGGKCNGTEPIQQGAATGNAAHRDSATNLSHDIFGDPVGPSSTDKVDAKCIQKVIQRSTQAFTEIIKAERSCKKNGMKSGAVVDSATLDTTCGTFATIDAGGKAAAKLAKISADVTAACAATTTPLATLFDGLSGGCHASATALGLCLQAKTRCEACKTLNTADGQSMNCDTFDDSLSNDSCVTSLGSATCTLAPSSALNLVAQFGTLPLTPVGSLNIDCGLPDGNGVSACSCSVNSFNPIVIVSIGDVCVNPASCPSGELDCDGGSSTNVDVVGDHNIGACTSDTSCKNSCDSHCAGLGSAYSRISYGCEGFCQGGTNNDAACTDDSQCPAGSCTGVNPPGHPGVCGCTCQAEGLGGAQAAGSFTCPVGTQIDVELPTDGDCADADTIKLPAICGAVTSTTATGVIIDANNGAGTLPTGGPNSQTGVGTTCANVAASTVSGLKLGGHLAFFDTTLGDIFSENTFACQ